VPEGLTVGDFRAVPEGLTVGDFRAALATTGTRLRYITASHAHWDHLDTNVLGELNKAFPGAEFLDPSFLSRHEDVMLDIGGEPVWLLKAPKHSGSDVVTVFRGVAMTGDIELGALESVTNEVPLRTRKRSMHYLASFPWRHGYHVHSIASAHLNDVRTNIHWPDLFRC
jgi:hypothetical protein